MFETHLPFVTMIMVTPFHKVFNSSTNGLRYTSMFSFVIDYFPRINKASVMKNHLVVNHGGKL